MLVVDTSVWVDHLRHGNEDLASRLKAAEVHCHPFVIGEIACGNIARRKEIISLLGNLPQAPLADHDEVLAFVEVRGLAGSGIGWVDAHLLASAALARAPLWTLDSKLARVAARLGLSP